MKMVPVLDRFLPSPDVRDRHAITVHAPARVVMEVARNFDMQSVWLVHAIFWLRSKMLRAAPSGKRRPAGLVEEMLGLGWGILTDEPERFLVAGAWCQPWNANVAFSPIPVECFEAYAEPDRVKIAWTLEVEALDAGRTRLATETRAVATDQQARAKLRRYWRLFGIGIVLIRRLLLPAVRRQAARQWRADRASDGRPT